MATEDGQVRIDEIKLGDKVWAYNVETGETELKEVTHIYVHEVKEILHLYTSEGQIDTTTNHPFYVVDKGWIAAGDLKAGDEVYQLDGTTTVVVGSELEKFDEAIKVYNLEVEDLHSYFVGEELVLVHNYKNDGKKADVDESVESSRTEWGPEHGKGNVKHNNAIESELDDAFRNGATDIRKNRVQRDVNGNRVFAPDGTYTRPDASYVINWEKIQYELCFKL